MPAVSFGEAPIPYPITRSPRARRMRIVVRSGEVSVVAPPFVRRRTILAFVESKRRWIESKVEAQRQRTPLGAPARCVSGAKVLCRGRQLELRVEPAPVETASLRFANAFHARVPRSLDGAASEAAVRRLLIGWFEKRARADAGLWAREHGAALGVRPARIRIGDQKTLWGSCSARGVISLNWRLVAAPRPVFEYVVVHELCHLIERNHGRRFWRLVAGRLPDYRERRAWLKRRDVGLA